MKGESVSMLVILWHLVNDALGITWEFVIWGVTDFGYSGVIAGAFELPCKSICGIGKTRLSLYKKNES